jgi:hypothetical protein
MLHKAPDVYAAAGRCGGRSCSVLFLLQEKGDGIASCLERLAILCSLPLIKLRECLLSSYGLGRPCNLVCCTVIC